MDGIAANLNGRKPVVVVSAVNLTEMGGLSILKDCLRQLAQRADDYAVVALVHKKELVGIPNIHYYEFPRSKRSILDRLYHEYWVFWKLSQRLEHFLWLSLHNTTPRVSAQRRAVYCQNVTNLYPLTWREALTQPRFAVVNRFLGFMYRVNLYSNTFVVVQQEWVRQAFQRRFHLNNIVVAHPTTQVAPTAPPRLAHSSAPFIFFYPSHPSVHKNFETVCDAAKQMINVGATNFEIWLTLGASDNRYAQLVGKACAEVSQIKLLGRLDREEVFHRYRETDCLIFASKLETWGLAISEFKGYGRPMIIANAAYAREAVGDHPYVAFFSVDSAKELASLMIDAMHGAKSFGTSTAPTVAPPFAASWSALFDILLDPVSTSAMQQCAIRFDDPLIPDVPKSI